MRRLRLAAGCLYACLGILMGFAQAGLPAILRAQGAGLGSLGWVYVLYLPMALPFVWASLVDWRTLPWLSRRIGWIVAAQATAAVFLLVVSFGESWPPSLLLVTGLATAAAVATMDIALEGLVVDTVGAAERPTIGALKIGGLWAGAAVGGGVLVGLFSKIGWQSAFAAMALLVALLTLPILTCRSLDLGHGHRVARPSLGGFLRRERNGRRLALLMMLAACVAAISGFGRLALVDIGVSLETIGWAGAGLTLLVGLAVIPVALLLLKRRGQALALIVFTGLCVAGALLILASLASGNGVFGLVGIALGTAGNSAIWIVIYAVLIGWSAGEQPATDYATFYSGGNFAAIVTMISLPSLIEATGWVPFYAGIIPVAVLAALFFLRQVTSDAVVA